LPEKPLIPDEYDFMRSLILEYDDFHWAAPENCLDVIERFKSEVPDIKITMFTVPNLRGAPLYDNVDWCRRVRALCDEGTLEIARHGFSHSPLEYEYCDYDYAVKSLLLGDRILETAGIPYVKVFRGPYWGLNDATVMALNNLGYTHLYNHIDHSSIGHNFNGKVVFYNWNLANEAPDFNFLVGHGHTHNVCGNGISETLEKVLSFIHKVHPKFKFASSV